MRLIDAEALKAELEAYRHTRNYKSDEDEAQNNLLDNILEDVDKAPTVEPSLILNNISDEDIEKFKLIWQRSTSKGLLLQPERPKGEWVEFADFVARNVVSKDFDEDVGFYAEVLCRKLVKLGLVKLDGDTYKYCGADMRGGEES